MAALTDPVQEAALNDKWIDRRSEFRHPYNLETTCWVLQGTLAPHWSATVQDISTEGIGLLVDHPCSAGTGLLVTLRRRTGGVPFVVLVQVTHVRAHGPSEWAVGGPFANKLSHTDLLLMVGE